MIKGVNLIERSQVVFSLESVEDDNNKKNDIKFERHNV